MKVLSLFAGIGGIDLGLERVGCTTVAYSEIDPYACTIMAARFPDAEPLGDITRIDWNAVRWAHAPDIIAGGFPCQDISLAGKGAGIEEGTRSGLWTYYADAIRQLRPRGVLVENVAALTSRGLDTVLGDLAACGYDAEWECVRASRFGFPHHRERMFIIAYAADGGGQRAEVQGRWQLAAEQVARRARAATGDSGRFEWTAEPEVVRSPDGLPDWMDEQDEPGIMISPYSEHSSEQRWDRLATLGNAVVPQVAEHVGRILFERMEARR